MTGKTLQIDLDEDEPTAGAAGEAIIDEDNPAPGARREADVIDEDVSPDDKLPSQAIQNADRSVTLPLAYPVTLRTRKDGKVREQLFGSLTFHRLNGADQRAVSAASAEASVPTAFARSTRISQAVMNALFDKMDMADITDCGRVLNHFLTSGRRTGR